MRQEKVYFQNKQGLVLCGILQTPVKETKKCIILCHGFADNKDEGGVFSDLSNELVNSGLAVFRFDFTSHGESEGDSRKVSIHLEMEDIASCVSFLKEGGFAIFGILGASFGAGPVLLYASRNPTLFHALVIWNGLIDYAGLILGKGSTWFEKYWGEKVFTTMKKDGFAAIGSRKFLIGEDLLRDIQSLSPWQMLDHLHMPILFIHGDHDSYIPYGDAQKYAKMFELPLYTVVGSEHGFHDDYKHEEEANRAAIDFFLKNM